MQSIRQVFLSLGSGQIALPYINPRISGQQEVLWKPPVYMTVSNLLTNPVYAGAYAFPNRKSDDNRKWPQANRARPSQSSLGLGSLAR
ncbi:recombinase family protein [Mesorhizobium sp. MSK_1335]|uniref:Recombinase family protein n=1 Tax=Mesorhizobium montanum TaxID=3072323 RepID=A0ABU4ZZ16_9HYPH|nr:recombinase family protein [Mesorhizobium sp. MSK_1335]MDX8529258.1 recombinase family protein [Mesorhizobium sp. MSK_1335]